MADNEGVNAGKTQADLAAEQAKNAEIARQQQEEQAKADAEDRAAAAERAVQDATEPGPKAAGKGAGTDPKLADGVSLHEQQIRDGKAPIAPGPEKPVDEDDAKQAKENRGR